MSNFLSLYGALYINGKLQEQRSFADLDATTIVYVTPGTAVNSDGATVGGFFVLCEDVASIEPFTVFLFATSTLATISDFASGLVSLGVDCTFTTFTGLTAIDGLAQDSVSVLISDKFVTETRSYNPTADTTSVQVKCSNWLVRKIFTFAGKQTTAASYTYFPA